MFCPKRFKCNANGKVSIDVQFMSDGKADCDDSSDENECFSASRTTRTFSSDSEMKADPVIKAAFWIMGSLVIVENACVIANGLAFLKKTRAFDSIKFQHAIILNIAIADFIMGIYLLAIAFYDMSFSEVYGGVDRDWRSSLKYSIIGSLTVISRETSCFLMVILTAFRLKNITNAIESLSLSVHPWKILICMAWIFSLLIGMVPMLKPTSQ